MKERFEFGRMVSNAVDNTRRQVGETKTTKAAKTLYWAYVVSILLTTIEIPDLNIASSFAAVLFLTSLFIVSSKHILSPMVWLLLVMSIASGFSGPLLDTRQADNKALCISIIGSTECVEQTIEGLYILGLPMKDISRMAAVKAGKLNRLDFNDYVRGYGLISLARVTVIGD